MKGKKDIKPERDDQIQFKKNSKRKIAPKVVEPGQGSKPQTQPGKKKNRWLLKLLPFILLIAAFILLAFFGQIPAWIGSISFGVSLLLIFFLQACWNVRAEFFVSAFILLIALASILSMAEDKSYLNHQIKIEDTSGEVGSLVEGQYVTIYMSKDIDPAEFGDAESIPLDNLQIIDIFYEQNQDGDQTVSKPKRIEIRGPEDKIERVINLSTDGYKAWFTAEEGALLDENGSLTLEIESENILGGIGGLVKGHYATVYMVKDPDPAKIGDLDFSTFYNLRIVEILDENNQDATLTGELPNSILVSGFEETINEMIKQFSDGFKAWLMAEGKEPREIEEQEIAEAIETPACKSPVYVLPRCEQATCAVKIIPPPEDASNDNSDSQSGESLKVNDNIFIILVYEECAENCRVASRAFTREVLGVNAVVVKLDNSPEEISIKLEKAADSEESMNFAKLLTQAVEIYIHKLPKSSTN